MSETLTPTADNVAVAESFRFLLLQNIGNNVVVELLLGERILERRCGLLTSVGADYILLADEANGQQIAGELSSVKLITLCGALPVPASDAQTDEDIAAQEQATLKQYSAAQTRARPQSQAAFNYAKRKTRRLD